MKNVISLIAIILVSFIIAYIYYFSFQKENKNIKSEIYYYYNARYNNYLNNKDFFIKDENDYDIKDQENEIIEIRKNIIKLNLLKDQIALTIFEYISSLSSIDYRNYISDKGTIKEIYLYEDKKYISDNKSYELYIDFSDDIILYNYNDINTNEIINSNTYRNNYKTDFKLLKKTITKNYSQIIRIYFLINGNNIVYE